MKLHCPDPVRTGGFLIVLLGVLVCGSRADGLRESSIPLLMRPGIPQNLVQFTLLGDGTGAGNASQEPGSEYLQYACGGIVRVNMLRRENMVLQMYAGALRRELDHDIIFETGLQLPDTLERGVAGFIGKTILDSQNALSFKLGVNSASDTAYHSRYEIDIEGELLFRRFMAGNNVLMAGLIYFDQFGYPLPLAGFTWSVSPTMMVTLGTTPGIRWQISDRWRLNGLAIPFAGQGELSVTRGFGPALPGGYGFPVTLGATMYRESWRAKPVNRMDTDYDVEYKEWRSGLTGELMAFRWLSVNAEMGWAFDRKIREQDNPPLFHEEDYVHTIDFESALYGRISARIRF